MGKHFKPMFDIIKSKCSGRLCVSAKLSINPSDLLSQRTFEGERIEYKAVRGLRVQMQQCERGVRHPVHRQVAKQPCSYRCRIQHFAVP